MKRPLLALVMPVYNEATNLRAVLEAARPHIDSFAILDTGSTDDTKKIIIDVLGDLPGQIHVEPAPTVAEICGWQGFEGFVHYGALRNRVLDLHRHTRPSFFGVAHEPAQFELMLSGDEYLRNGDRLRQHLEAHRDSEYDAHFIRVDVEIEEAAGPQPRVTRTHSAWRYEDPIHENLTNRKPAPDRPPLVIGVDGVTIDHLASNQVGRLEHIWEKHIPVLRRWLQAEPDHPRALYYLARSLATWMPGFEGHERIQYGMEGLGLLLRRLALPDIPAIERNHITLGFLNLAREVGLFTTAELFGRAEQLFLADPRRPDVALLVAEIGRQLATEKQLSIVKVYDLYARAALVAEAAAETIDDSVPVSTAAGWQAHYYAALVARQLAVRFPEQSFEESPGNFASWSGRVRRHFSAGLAAGGTWDVFKKLQEPVVAPPPAPAPETAA